VDEVLELALVDLPAAGGRRRAARRKAE
jgi:hypothetical protein